VQGLSGLQERVEEVGEGVAEEEVGAEAWDVYALHTCKATCTCCAKLVASNRVQANASLL
jgi:hypothetical protein